MCTLGNWNRITITAGPARDNRVRRPRKNEERARMPETKRRAIGRLARGPFPLCRLVYGSAYEAIPDYVANGNVAFVYFVNFSL